MLKNVLKETFEIMKIELSKSYNIDTVFSGTTCVIVLIQKNFCICANLGDSRAVLGTNFNDGWVVACLSNDHKPDDVNEKNRIEKNGGIVKACKGII